MRRMTTSPRCWKVELAAVIMVSATLLAAAPARADLFAPAEGLRPLNLQVADPAVEPPKVDAPSAIPPSAPPATPDSDQPFYKTPRFWVFAGLALVGAVAVVWGGSQLIHEINGGDPKSCGAMSIACAGEGR
jgi:hypothetical protein